MVEKSRAILCLL